MANPNSGYRDDSRCTAFIPFSMPEDYDLPTMDSVDWSNLFLPPPDVTPPKFTSQDPTPVMMMDMVEG